MDANVCPDTPEGRFRRMARNYLVSHSGAIRENYVHLNNALQAKDLHHYSRIDEPILDLDRARAILSAETLSVLSEIAERTSSLVSSEVDRLARDVIRDIMKNETSIGFTSAVTFEFKAEGDTRTFTLAFPQGVTFKIKKGTPS